MQDRIQRMKDEWAREYPHLDSNVMATVGALLEAARRLDKNWLAPFAARFDLQRGNSTSSRRCAARGRPMN